MKKNRSLSGFHSIKVEDGVDVYIKQGNTESVTVKADENLVEMIKTEVDGQTLYISSKGSVYRSKAFDVYVVVKDLERLKAEDGSDVYSLSKITVDQLELTMKGGSDVEMEVEANTIQCDLVGGADAKLSGSVGHLIAKARGGSDLKAKHLSIDKCELDVRGGSDAWVKVNQEIDAQAYGGSDIYYTGDPKIIRQKAKGSSDIHSN